MNDVSTQSGKPALSSRFIIQGIHSRAFLPQFPIQPNVISKLALNYLRFFVSRSGADVPWQFDVHNPPCPGCVFMVFKSRVCDDRYASLWYIRGGLFRPSNRMKYHLYQTTSFSNPPPVSTLMYFGSLMFVTPCSSAGNNIVR